MTEFLIILAVMTLIYGGAAAVVGTEWIEGRLGTKAAWVFMGCVFCLVVIALSALIALELK